MSDCCLLETTVQRVKQKNMKSLLTTDQISYEKNNISIRIGLIQKPIHVTINTLVVVYYRGHALV